jgi:hypothetical protein
LQNPPLSGFWWSVLALIAASAATSVVGWLLLHVEDDTRRLDRLETEQVEQDRRLKTIEEQFEKWRGLHR